uniref:Exostosin GT47 domain-containing protein n=1 Tax=Leersia perrieri TaxID=77586 RepID=A0A0D9VT19_9ORYZ
METELWRWALLLLVLSALQRHAVLKSRSAAVSGRRSGSTEMVPDAREVSGEGHEIVEVAGEPGAPSAATMRLMDFIPIYIPTVERGALSQSVRKRRFLDFLRAHPSRDWFLRLSCPPKLDDAVATLNGGSTPDVQMAAVNMERSATYSGDHHLVAMRPPVPPLMQMDQEWQ